MNIDKQHIGVSKFARPGYFRPATDGIVWHWVGNAGQGAEGVRRYFDSLDEQDPGDDERDIFASAHYVVGLEGEIIELIPKDEIAYHCGGRS